MVSLVLYSAGCYFLMFTLVLVTFIHIFKKKFFFCFFFFYFFLFYLLKRILVFFKYCQRYQALLVELFLFITLFFRQSISYPIHQITFNSDAVLGILNYRSLEKSNNSIYKMTRNHISFIKSLSFSYHCFEKVYILLLTLQYKFVLLKCHGDIEMNPVPEKLKAKRKMLPLSPIGVLIP